MTTGTTGKPSLWVRVPVAAERHPERGVGPRVDQTDPHLAGLALQRDGRCRHPAVDEVVGVDDVAGTTEQR